jgi:hypothetical protein
VGHMEDMMDIKFATHEEIQLDTVEKNIYLYEYIKKLKTVCKSMVKLPLPKTKYLT